MSLESYVQAAPKAELHVHLEGAIQPSTALAIARRNSIPLPVESEAELRQRFAYRDFDHFIETFILITGCLRTSEDYEQIVYEFGAEMARQHVLYAEVTVTPATHSRLGVPHEIYFSGMQRGRARAQADFNVSINWIFNIVRRWVDPTQTRPMADFVTRVAIEGKDDGVVALAYTDHPLPQLYAKGVTITVSTDDPPLFNTTMNQEVTLLATQFGLNVSAIDEILLNGIRYSFLPEAHRRKLETTFRLELADLKAKHINSTL